VYYYRSFLNIKQIKKILVYYFLLVIIIPVSALSNDLINYQNTQLKFQNFSSNIRPKNSDAICLYNINTKTKSLLFGGRNREIFSDIKNFYGDNDNYIEIYFNEKNRSLEYALNQITIPPKTRIDIHSHGYIHNSNHIMELESNKDISTHDALQFISKKANNEPLFFHIWSCFSNSANQYIKELPDGSMLITHSEKDRWAFYNIENIAFLKSIKYYKDNQSMFQSFLSNIHFGSTQTETFNIKLEGKVERLEIKPNFRNISSKEKAKKFLNSEADRFNKWYQTIQVKYTHTYPDILKEKTLKLPNFSSQDIDTFITGVFLHECYKATEKFIDFLENGEGNFLLKHYINDTRFKSSPILHTSEVGHKKLAEILLKHGSDPNLTYNNGRTPLFVATRKEYVDLVKLLLEYKADPNLGDNYENSPLLLAVYNENKEILKMLIEYGAENNFDEAEINIKTKYKEIKQELLENRLDPLVCRVDFCPEI